MWGGSFGHLFCARRRSDDETPTEPLNARIADEIAPRFCLSPTCCRDSHGPLSQPHVAFATCAACFLPSSIFRHPPFLPVITNLWRRAKSARWAAPPKGCLLLWRAAARARDVSATVLIGSAQLRRVGIRSKQGPKQLFPLPVVLFVLRVVRHDLTIKTRNLEGEWGDLRRAASP